MQNHFITMISASLAVIASTAMSVENTIDADIITYSNRVPEANSETLHRQDVSMITAPAKSPINATTQACPEHFYSVKLPSDGKLCQVFAVDLPASMIFFVPQPPHEIIEYYQQDSTSFTNTKAIKGRHMLQSRDKNTTLIISSDGAGTQVDILVKESNL